MVDNLLDTITHVTLEDKIFWGIRSYRGRMSYFPIAFCMGLTIAHRVQRYCVVCDLYTFNNDNQYTIRRKRRLCCISGHKIIDGFAIQNRQSAYKL